MFTILLFLLFSQHAIPADPFAFNTPTQIEKCLQSLGSEYKLSDRLNPFYLRADFDGTGKADYAVLVTNSKAARGLIVCRAAVAKPVVLGAGTAFNRMRDLDFGAWMVFPKGPVQRGVEAGAPPKLVGDALLLVWPESASALAYWYGTKFRWYQQGD